MASAMTRVNLIFARAANGVIGRANALPWHLPEDLAHFRKQTSGAPVIMGRHTWDSLPQKFQPLPNRANIVVTRQHDWAAPGAVRVGSLPDAIAHGELLSAPELWVMGGAQIYAEAEPLAARVLVTEIHQDFDGDAFAPTLGADWRESSRESHTAVNGLSFSFVTFER
ncbi:MAG: dihydrofolate reductase [Gemmatimonadaceae bacterium]